MDLIQSLHNKALEIVREFKKKETELIEILIEIDSHKVFLRLGYSSLFQYCLDALKLTENQSYQFIGIARKSVEAPEIKEAIDSGKINISSARRIVSVITPENKDLWLEKAATLPQRKLEMEIVKVQPKLIKKEMIKPVIEGKFELRTYLDKEGEENLKRIKDLLSQKFKRALSAEEVMSYLMRDYLKRYDPIQKAERAINKKEQSAAQNSDELYLSIVDRNLKSQHNINIPAPSSGRQFYINSNFAKVSHTFAKGQFRQPIPAQIKHAVALRDRNQCTHTHNGQRCSNQRWLHLHHIKPVTMGGENMPENLTTLCSSHHKFLHR